MISDVIPVSFAGCQVVEWKHRRHLFISFLTFVEINASIARVPEIAAAEAHFEDFRTECAMGSEDVQCADAESSSYAENYRLYAQSLNRLKHVVKGVYAITMAAWSSCN